MNTPRLTEAGRVEIVRRLLKLARAGKCGAIYCERGRLQLGNPLNRFAAPLPITWGQAQALADTWTERKPSKRTPRMPVAKRA